MKYSELKKIIKSHQLRITDCRMDVLELFASERKALSLKDVESLTKDYDKVTLYRTLGSFLEHGILHKIPDDNGETRYGVCYDTCDADNHQHEHLHFKCVVCRTTECLTTQKVPDINVPNYQVLETNVILSGICSRCQ